jgi:hypothetical protein
MGREDTIKAWKEMKIALEPMFGGDLDIQAILFIIGVQELGHGYQKLEKEQKVDVMHIAICTLLEPFGYYEYIGRDEDNWPHWKATGSMPHMKPMDQNRFMQDAIVAYFRRKGLIS